MYKDLFVPIVRKLFPLCCLGKLRFILRVCEHWMLSLLNRFSSFFRKSVRSWILLWHVQSAVAEQAACLRIQASVDTDESRRCGQNHGLSTGNTTGKISFIISKAGEIMPLLSISFIFLCIHFVFKIIQKCVYIVLSSSHLCLWFCVDLECWWPVGPAAGKWCAKRPRWTGLAGRVWTRSGKREFLS